MLVQLPTYRLQVALALVALALGAYGARQLVDAGQYGTSTRLGTEAFAGAGVLVVVLVVTLVVKQRRIAERRKFPHRV